MAEGQPQTRRSLRYLLSRTSALHVWVSACVAIWVLAACTTPYKHPQLRPAEAGFAGIDDSFSPQTPEVDVLLIHGMGTHTETWVQTMVSQLAAALGFPVPTTLPPPDPLQHDAKLYRYSLTSAHRRLQLSAVLWSPVTSTAKATLCYDVEQATSLCTDPTKFSTDKRAWANNLIKSQIMDDRLSDVTFYLNEEGGRQIRDAIEDALLRALSAEGMSFEALSADTIPTAKNAPLFVISESLGSKIVVDALKEFESRRQTREFAQQTRGNIHTLFLLANQIPILNLGVGSRSRDSSHYPHLTEFAEARNAHRNSRLPDVPLHVVAFSDPNDVFSYQLTPDALLQQHAIISNVVVSNDHTVLGFYEDPGHAHTCYLKNSPVSNAIAHGSGALEHSSGIHCAQK